jgi:methyl-accepting chemotaxis protein
MPERAPLWRELRSLRHRFLLPILVVGSVYGTATACHIALTGTWPEGSLETFSYIVPPVVVVVLWLGLYRTRARLPVVWALGQKHHRPTSWELRQALDELGSLPAWGYRATFEHWFLALMALAGGFAALSEGASNALHLRILLLGVLCAPFTALLMRMLQQRTCRRGIQRILEEGLPSVEVFRALPPERRGLKAQMVLLVASALVAPALFTYDAAFSAAGMDLDAIATEAYAPARHALAQSMSNRAPVAILALLAFWGAAAVFAAFLLGSLWQRPLRQLAAGSGQWPNVVAAEDEAWVISAAFLKMRGELEQTVTQLRSAGQKLGSAGGSLQQTFEGQTAGANEQSAALNETFATTEELAHSAAQIAESAQGVAAVAEKTLAAAENGQKSSQQFHASMRAMKQNNQAVADSVVKLNKRMQQIGTIVEFINGIADKSDLLALNAELEGTKAGRVGRGFSLVAAEMRRLSENVIHSTDEIVRLIQETRDATNAAVMATEAGTKATEAGIHSAERVLESLQQILDLATQTSAAVRSISGATRQQQAGTNELAVAMGDILRVTEQSADATRQMAAATMDLSALAKDLVDPGATA